MSEKAFKIIQEKRLTPWKGEEEVRYSWMMAIEAVTGLSLNAERGRKDSSLNHVIIEFKAPGLFKGKKDSPAFKNATEERLLPYIQRESINTGIPESDFIGIAIDGEHICFAQVKNGIIATQHLIPFSEYAVELVVDAFNSDTRRAFTTENLLADFGHGSLMARNFMQAMSDGLLFYLKASGNNKVKMLFEEWRTLYGQVADMSILQAEAINKEIAFSWNGENKDSLPARLFIIHTYNSILIKLIAAEIVSAHGLTSIKHPTQSMSAICDNIELIRMMEAYIERSEIFEQAGLSSFIEEVIFSWYIQLAKDNLSNKLLLALRQILSRLSLYRLDYLKKTRDILRDLYQGLVPGKLRQSLGEFYTPDWLVDFTVDKVADEEIVSKKILDPTCGSGAFLLAIIRKKRTQAELLNLNYNDTLKMLCDTVWGFDLNPLAVQTARVNFLIEIADLLEKCPGSEIEVPILLADAIYSPASSPKADDKIVEYNIGSQVAKLNILLPSELAIDRNRLDLVFKRMGHDVECSLDFDIASKNLVESAILTSEEIASWKEPLKHTYDQVLALHKQQWNGIWFRIVRNFFWSATAGHFDVIVGNPPWVRWSKLPELYRSRVKPTCEHYGIFSKTKRHGGNELDISAMITYTVTDKWLKENGKLAFVLTGTLFKNPSSAGFRTFKIEPNNESSFYLQPLEVDDMKPLKPFEDASNHTSVAIFEKISTSPKYPVPYFVWNPKKGHKKAISATNSLQSVLATLDSNRNEAFPVADEGSPWAILPPGRFSAIKYLSNRCDWTQGRKGITTDLNGVYFIPVIQNNGDLVQIESRPEAGKKDIGPKRTLWVEPDLLYPLIKGAGDFEACYLKITGPTYDKDKLYTFVPNTGISNEDYRIAENEIFSPKLKRTLSWFKNFEDVLLDRSTYRRQMKGAPFHAIYNIGDYTFKPWKVIWPEMSSSFYSAVAGSDDVPVVGERVFIPDHKVYYASFDDKDTAYYLCGLLNSNTVKEWIESHNVSIQIADVFKHLNLPVFDIDNVLHIQLSGLVETAHQTHDSKKRKLIIDNIKSAAESILEQWSENCSS
ncbi:Eco57I restriction-modification methylase domain-containing protein [Vibrio metschnikovii]|uniref:Eco57I restriction-modification methylase domain-containing protein n=1 Tax=Vibrio metschnikovii TaxID=28172 RepID=UPI002FC6EC13